MKEYDLNAGEIPDLDQIPRKLMRKGMRKIARTVSDRVKSYIPVQTGKLRRSVRSRVPADGRSAQILVGRAGRGQPFYAHLVEGGTRPHRIPVEFRGRGITRQHQRGYLAKLGGRVVFVKAFTHPGSPAVRFLERGATDSVRQIESILVDLGEQELGAL